MKQPANGVRPSGSDTSCPRWLWWGRFRRSSGAELPPLVSATITEPERRIRVTLAQLGSRNAHDTPQPLAREYEVDGAAELIRDEVANDLCSIARTVRGRDSGTSDLLPF